MHSEIKWDGNKKTHFIYLENYQIIKIIPENDSEDIFEVQEKGIQWIRRTKVPVEHMIMECETLFEMRHTMVPGIAYDGNPWGNDHEFKGYEKDGKPWTYAFHRSAVPGASSSEGDDIGIAIYGENHPSSCVFLKEKKAVHRVIWPETEEPYVLMADSYLPPFYGSMEPRSEFVAWIFIGTSKEEAGWKQMLCHKWETEWGNRGGNLLPERMTKEIWEMSVEYAKLLYTEEQDGFKGFSIGLYWDGKKWIKREESKYEIGWCGQNASLAVSLLRDYELHQDEEALKIGLAVLDSWATLGVSKEGHMLTRYDPEDSLIDACNLGTAGLQYMEAYEQAQRMGIEKPEYWNAGIKICNFIVERQRADGGIGMSWYRDGSPKELSGTAGAFLILPLAEASIKICEDRYRVAAEKAYAYYFGEFMRNGYSTAGALDTCCIDKESAIPLLKGGLLLHKATGQQKYLEMAEEAAWYLSTWQWHQTVNYPENSTLFQLGYDTFGGTAVSTSHQHIDPFALSYVEDLMQLGKLTGEEQWSQRARAVWYNGVQGISDGSLIVGDTGIRPRGIGDEGFLHTRWGSMRPGTWGEPYSTTQWLVAWPCAFRLETLRRCSEWNQLDGNVY